MKRLLLLASAIWLACVAAVAAPNIQCTGQVVDEANEPLIGATVTAVGTAVSVPTDVDGNFKISVPDGCKLLRVTYIGFKDLEVAPKAALGVLVMATDSKMLSDVVVTQSIGKTRETPVAMSTISAQ